MRARGEETDDATRRRQIKLKNSKNLFISIDEASNHVRPFGPNKVKAFRLLFTIFQLECDANGHAISNVDLSKAKFLGSGFSTPIRVFANNDVPKGAAAIEVRCSVQSNWNGWKQKPYATEEALKEAFSDLPQEKHACGKEEKKTKKNNTTTTTSKLEKNGKVSVAKESAEEKKKRKMLAKQAKELEKDRASAKEVAARQQQERVKKLQPNERMARRQQQEEDRWQRRASLLEFSKSATCRKQNRLPRCKCTNHISEMP